MQSLKFRTGSPHWEICGIPDVLYTDNGPDFTSNHLDQVAADLKIQLVFSTPSKPQGRGRIERFFRTVNEMFLCDLDDYVERPGLLGKVQGLSIPEKQVLD